MAAPRNLPEVIDSRRYGLRGYPHELWTELRRDAPLKWFEGEGLKPFWAVTRHRDVRLIGEQPARFLNAPRIMADLDVRPNLVWSRHLLNMDPPEHEAYRSILAPRFSARSLTTMAARIEAVVAAALDRLESEGPSWEGDFATAIVREIPAALIADILGVPSAERARLVRWAQCMVAPADPEYQRGRSTEETYLQAERELFGWFAPKVVERRANPGSDLVSLLASARIHGKPIAARDVLSFCQLFVTAGIDTTAAAICRATHALAEHPDQYRWLREHPGEIATAAEELLRFASPVIHFCRTSVDDVEIRGCKIRRGQTLVLFYPSANRDEELFEKPFELRLDRRQNDHLAFGSGDHFCLGAPLARMLLHQFLARLVARVQSLEATGPLECVHSSVIGAVKRLPMRIRLVR
jgi:cholest-4-en-3-one 26-monooxygenase